MSRWRPVVYYRKGLYENVMRFTETYATKEQAIREGKKSQREWERLNPKPSGSTSRVTAVQVGEYPNNKAILKVMKKEREFEFGF